MPSLNEQSPLAGKDYWRSLDELADTQEFRQWMHHEFPAGAVEVLDSGERRHFLKIMGASMALAGLGLAGCRRWPEEQIAPYAHRPEDHNPGEPNHFATTYEIAGVGSGLILTSMDYRPIKVEGNPQHPMNRGATTAWDQAAILGLYDPDRSRGPLQNGKKAAWADFEQWWQSHHSTVNLAGGRVRILSEATNSPTVHALRSALEQRFGVGIWHEYEPIANDAMHAGTSMAFGAAHRPLYRFDRADVVICLDADPLGTDPAAVPNMRGYARKRRGGDDSPAAMSRWYCYEPGVTVTGANSDERHAVRRTDVAAVAVALAAKLLGHETLTLLAGQTDAATVIDSELSENLENAVRDLLAARGRAVIVVGPEQPAEVHYLAALMNDTLGALGRIVMYEAVNGAGDAGADANAPAQPGHAASLAALVDSMNAGTVDTLILVNCNPRYHAPADLNWGEAMRSVQNVIHFGDYRDESSFPPQWRAGEEDPQTVAFNEGPTIWHLNRAHPFESWTDARAWDGTYTLGQPLIQPLFDGRSTIEFLALLAGDDVQDGYELVRRTARQSLGGDVFETAWRAALHRGSLENSGNGFFADEPARGEEANARPARNGTATQTPLRPAYDRIDEDINVFYRRWAGGASRSGAGTVELCFVPDPKVYDGRFANNGWLQELPHPITKLTWDNAAIIGKALADELGVHDGDLMKIVTAEGASMEVPAFIVPGHHNRSVTLPLGYGRHFMGRIAHGSGFNFYPLRTTGAMGALLGATITRAGGSYPLATTQDHHGIDTESHAGKGLQARLPRIVRDADVRYYHENPNFAKRSGEVIHRLSMWEEDLEFQDQAESPPFQRYAWGMAVDLNACTGCSACVVACQAENNIPIVGKEQVRRGREMHWMRIDRYYTFARTKNGYDANRVRSIALQPMLCMHCENAPCEQVCPVAATTHDEDGLNVMVYNRCIGTRYCSNNCPYKVRRFNYFDWHRREPLREQPGMLLQVKASYWTKPQGGGEPLQRMQLNPEVTVRMRGIMEKCTYCVQRLWKAKIDAKNAFSRLPEDHPSRKQARVPIADGSVVTACAQACPAEAITFGDLHDRNSAVSRMHQHRRTYEVLEELNTKPRTKYLAQLWNPATRMSDPPMPSQGGVPHAHPSDDDHSHNGHGGEVH